MAREPALALATRALARRDLSEHELRQRLRRAGVTPAEEDEALGALQRGGLVDDARFALARAQTLAERGRGDAGIRFDLEQRGIAADVIEAALASLEPERERAERVAGRRGGGAATARLLAQRGFDEDVIEATVAHEA